jgi:hypothetical protein
MRLFRFAPLLVLLAQAAWPQGMLHLKTRTFSPTASSAPVRPGQGASDSVLHYVVMFNSYPGASVRAELARRRIQVLAYVPDNALMVSARELSLDGLGVSWVGPLDAADKISPLIVNQAAGAYLVIFQPDTDIFSDAALLQDRGFTLVQNASLLAGQLLATGPYSGISGLAALDAVAYILPASDDLQAGNPVMGCAGAVTEAGPVADYVLVDSGWSPDPGGGVALHYFFDSVTPDLSDSVIQSQFARAFAEWEQYANITITPASQPQMARSIDILFARLAHGDAYPFTGPGGVLAHTFYPVPTNPEPLAGDMHLNADESWTVGGAVDLYSVVLHETGHALGLGHSDNPADVMYPYYNLETGLSANDIAGVQALYGKSGQATTGTGSTGTTGTGSTGTTGTGSTGTGTTGTTGAGGTGTTGTGTGSTGTSGTAGTGSTGTTGTKSGSDTVPPSLTIVSPSTTIASSYSATISISGVASDNVGVTSVEWSTSTGSTGNATGTTSWSATIPLLVGNNVVTVRAYDAAGNSSWRALTVVRQ